MDNLIEGRIQSIKEIAQREHKGERYIRRLATRLRFFLRGSSMQLRRAPLLLISPLRA
jgi:hypothetical protein